jgi:hypothetical protein
VKEEGWHGISGLDIGGALMADIVRYLGRGGFQQRDFGPPATILGTSLSYPLSRLPLY